MSTNGQEVALPPSLLSRLRGSSPRAPSSRNARNERLTILFGHVRRLLARPLRRRRGGRAPALPELVPGPGRLALAGVGLDPVIVEVTAVAEPGCVVAVVGENGGRTALLSLAGGRLEPDRGRICLDGQDLAEHDPASIRQAVALLGAGVEHPPDGPSVLLVDEQVGLDPETVERAVSSSRGRTTVLVATDRREVVAAADSVWLLEEGRIVESGPPEGLLAGDTRTARLFD